VSQTGLVYLGDIKTTPVGLVQTHVASRGNAHLLQKKKTAIFCSIRCPGNLILQTYDFMCSLRDKGVVTIGGFHSPMGKECLRLLLRGTQPIIICPARSIEGMRIPAAWKQPLEVGRLLLLSPFEKKHRRMTADLARRRNEFVAVLADKVFVAHASPGGKTEQFCRKIISWGKPLLTFDCPKNTALLALGARPVRQ